MPDEEISAEELVEQIRQLKVSDLLVSSFSTTAQLTYAKIEESSRDLPQAQLGIEALRALVPVLEGQVPEDVLRDFRQLVANLQLAYADAAGTG